MAVVPEIETERPNRSSAKASKAVNFAVSVESAQPPPGFTNSYAEPEADPPSSSFSAPTMAMPPEIEIERPKKSNSKASEAVNFAV